MTKRKNTKGANDKDLNFENKYANSCKCLKEGDRRSEINLNIMKQLER